MSPDSAGTSTRPYLIRALHDWCTDNGFTPYLAVHVDARVQVPMEFVKNHEIVLNVSFEATSGLQLGNEFVEFKARFGGVPRDIVVPVDHVVAIYARENGQGMAFPMPGPGAVSAPSDITPIAATPPIRLASVEAIPSSDPKDSDGTASGSKDDGGPTVLPPSPAGGRPSLKRVK